MSKKLLELIPKLDHDESILMPWLVADFTSVHIGLYFFNVL